MMAARDRVNFHYSDLVDLKSTMLLLEMAESNDDVVMVVDTEPRRYGLFELCVVWSDYHRRRRFRCCC